MAPSGKALPGAWRGSVISASDTDARFATSVDSGGFDDAGSGAMGNIAKKRRAQPVA